MRPSNRPSVARVIVAALAAGATILAVACADPSTVPPEQVSADQEALYDMVRSYRQDYEEALARIVAGDEAAGRRMLDSAQRRMGVAARLCARTPGCDGEVFLAALERTVAALRDEGPPRGFDGGADTLEARPDLALAQVAPTPDRKAGPMTDADLLRAIPRNPAVLAALNDWLTWNRPQLMAAWENYAFLRSEIAPVYREAGLPEALLFAMLAKETGAKVHAYSRAGAAGPLQFMPHTGRRYGLGSVDGFDMRLDPVAATRANAAYLDDHLRLLDGDLELVLAAYNVGETRLRRLYRRHAAAGFWDPEIYDSLPWETRDYVPQVFAAALLFLEPERYGLSFPAIDAATTSLLLEQDVSLGELAVCLGQTGNPEGWFRTLRNLNPRRSATKRIAAGERIDLPASLVRTYADRCLGDAERIVLARDLHDASYPDEPELTHYTVSRGDTLAGIASRHRCWTVRKLAALNGIEAPEYVIHPGQRLAVPRCT